MACRVLKSVLKEKYIGKLETLVLMAPALMEKNGSIPTVVLLYDQIAMVATLKYLLTETVTHTNLLSMNMET